MHNSNNQPFNKVFFNGNTGDFDKANISILTHALHYSTSCFEGIRGNWNEDRGKVVVFRMKDHYERLLRSASILMIDIPYSAEQLSEITVKLIKENSVSEDIYIRPIAYKSAKQILNLKLNELEGSVSIIIVPFKTYIDPTSDIKGIDCMTSSWRRPDDTMMPTGVKISALYTVSILAKTEAHTAGFGEAILLNRDGTVSEGSGQNLFIIKNGVLHTPTQTDNCLIGITRDSIIKLAQEEMNLKVVERCINRSEIYLADEVFLTGTASHVVPVVSLDKRKIGTGKVGETTKSLKDLYLSVVKGNCEKYNKNWCTFV